MRSSVYLSPPPRIQFFKFKAHHKYLDEFIGLCERQNKSEHTLRNYKADITRFIVWFEFTYEKEIHKVSARVLAHYQDYLAGKSPVTLKKEKKRIFHWIRVIRPKLEKIPSTLKDLAPLGINSRRRHLSTLKNFFEYLKQRYEEESKKFRHNPVKNKLHAVKLKDVDIRHTILLTPEDWHKLDNSIIKLENRLILYLLYYAGLRVEELARLKFEYIDATKQIIRFPRKGGSVHRLKIHNGERLFHLYSLFLQKDLKSSVFLFSKSDDRPLSNRAMYQRILQMFKRAKCYRPGLGPHSFRKACATELYKETKDLLLVRDYLNHKDAKVTQTYIEI